MDIAKCRGRDCIVKYNCLRYTVKPDKYNQSYAMFDNDCILNKKECEEMILNKRITTDGKNE